MEDVMKEHMQSIETDRHHHEDVVQPPPIQQANAVQQHSQHDTVLPMLMQQMKSMQDMMQMMQSNMNNMQCYNTNHNNNTFNPSNPKAPNASRLEKKYCWTHGWCHHNGTECTRKAQGHKDHATITNRMNGSNKGCKKAPSNK